jgi:hypothetical protein
MARRKKTPKLIQRRIEITIGGRHAKTIRDRITVKQANAECPGPGGFSFFTGRGCKAHFNRRVLNVKLRFEYEQLQSEDFHVVHIDGMPDLSAVDPSLLKGGPVL